MKTTPAKRARAVRKTAKTGTTAKPQKRAPQVIDWLRERIRLGRFVPGQRLVEADIIRETQASRAHVREALQRLEAEGLVTIEEFKGASVKRFSIDEIRQIYRTRMALEGLAAADFAAADAPKLKQKLKSLQDQLNAGENTGDHERFARLNDEWHRLIIDGSGNTYISTFLERLRVPIYRLLFSTFYSARRIDNANAGHRQITKAILNGRSDEAEKLMRAHVAEGLQVIAQLDPSFFG
jgi:DNA-binding GntR family transcriptional regulator